MADNVELNVGSSGDVLAADDISGVKWQRIKLTLGADGVNDSDVSATNPMPTSIDAIASDVDLATETTVGAILADTANIDANLGTMVNSEWANEDDTGGGTDETLKLVGGTDTGGIVRTLNTDADGHLQIDLLTAPQIGVSIDAIDSSVDLATETSLVALDATVTDTNNLLGQIQWKHGDSVTPGTDFMNVVGGVDGSDDVRYLATDSDGHLQMDLLKNGSIVDSGNSTATPLVGAANFTGTGVDLLGYAAVCVTIYADVDSAVDGMTFEFSSTDDSVYDDIYTFTMDISSSDTRRFQFPVCARYFRISYTNGAGAQAAFRVQTILHTSNQLTSIHRLADDMSPDRSAQVVKSVLFAQAAGSGDFTAIDATAGGNLKVAIEESDIAAADGLFVRLTDGTDTALVDGSGNLETNVNNTVTVDLGSDNDVVVAGDVAHDAEDSGNPVKVGAKAIAHGASPTAVAVNDRTNVHASTDGILFTINGHPNTVSESQTFTAAATDEVQIAVGTGQRFVVTAVTALASNGNAADAQVLIEFDGSTDSPIIEHPGIPPGGGFTHGNGGGILKIGAEGADVLVTTDVDSGEQVNVTVTGYEIET